jgi:DNA repair exonuclease SbcCD nuclease subunit
MKYPYGIISDTHNHNFSSFATILENGLNSRLDYTLAEIQRAGEEVLKQGGNTLFHTGDLFHVRGNVCPSVQNPTKALFEQLTAKGLNIVLLAGNHDLESESASDLHNASTILDSIKGVTVVSEPIISPTNKLVMIPWFESLESLRDKVEELIMTITPEGIPSEYELMLHAPLNGVIPGMPDIGLTPEEVMEWGFKRVFFGHYHNHKNFKDKVFSVGATTHQTWGDIGSLAGFLIVSEDKVVHHKTLAPNFVAITGEDFEDMDTMLLMEKVVDNFVRLDLGVVSNEAIEKCKKYLLDMGARGVIVRATKKTEASRVDSLGTGATAGSVDSLEDATCKWIDANLDGEEDPDVIGQAKLIAMNALSTVEE